MWQRDEIPITLIYSPDIDSEIWVWTFLAFLNIGYESITNAVSRPNKHCTWRVFPSYANHLECLECTSFNNLIQLPSKRLTEDLGLTLKTKAVFCTLSPILYLIVDGNGGVANEMIFPFVGDQVELFGRIETAIGIRKLFVAPGSVRRL